MMAALDLGLVVTPLFLKDTIQEKELRLGSGIERFLFPFLKHHQAYLKCSTC